MDNNNYCYFCHVTVICYQNYVYSFCRRWSEVHWSSADLVVGLSGLLQQTRPPVK